MEPARVVVEPLLRGPPVGLVSDYDTKLDQTSDSVPSIPDRQPGKIDYHEGRVMPLISLLLKL